MDVKAIIITVMHRWHGYAFWIPIVAPFIGGLLGAWSYHFFIGMHVPDEMDAAPEGQLSDKGRGVRDGELDPLNKEEI